MTRFTPQEKAAAARRELNLRRRVYPVHVELGKMSKRTADRQIALMTEIATDYEAMARAEQPSSFGKSV